MTPMTLDNQLSRVASSEADSPNLLDPSQESVVPATELPSLPPSLPSYAARSQESSGYDDEDQDDQSSNYIPTPDKTPTKTTGLDDDSHSGLEIEMGQNTESPFRTDFCFGQFDGEYDMAAEEYSFHDRVMHHLGGRRIDTNNRLAVEFACILETGTIVTDKHTMENKEIDFHFEEEYVRVINGFKSEDFQERALQNTMRHKLYRANKPLQGHRLKKKFREMRAEIRADWIPLLPLNISQLASGNQLRDAYKALIVKLYRANNVSSVLFALYLPPCSFGSQFGLSFCLLLQPEVPDDTDDADVYSDIPADWWLFPDSKARLLLACMVHRRNKEIAPLCTGHKRGQTRETQRQAKEARVTQQREEERQDRANRIQSDPRMQRQQRLQEDVARMAIIEKDIDATAKKASYVEKMIEIYYKTQGNLVARYGQEWFDNKIAETVAMLPDGNKSLLEQRKSVENDEDGTSDEEE